MFLDFILVNWVGHCVKCYSSLLTPCRWWDVDIFTLELRAEESEAYSQSTSTSTGLDTLTLKQQWQRYSKRGWLTFLVTIIRESVVWLHPWMIKPLSKDPASFLPYQSNRFKCPPSLKSFLRLKSDHCGDDRDHCLHCFGPQQGCHPQAAASVRQCGSLVPQPQASTHGSGSGQRPSGPPLCAPQAAPRAYPHLFCKL